WWNAGGTMAMASSGKHFVKMSFSRGTGSTSGTRLNHITPGFAGRFYLKYRVKAAIRECVCSAIPLL
ncbi:hypothetical protein, partial [Pseudomonas aeruginosa]|uniref:hypothetical protein n=1 Tax=Pseudomonas aeruginosa TaxID=287 RepID=UPI001C6158BC